MRTLKLFALSIIYGQTTAFLTDLLLFRLARSMFNLSEARDLYYLNEDHDQDWGHLLENSEGVDPDQEEEYEYEEEREPEKKEKESYRASFFSRQEA